MNNSIYSDYAQYIPPQDNILPDFHNPQPIYPDTPNPVARPRRLLLKVPEPAVPNGHFIFDPQHDQYHSAEQDMVAATRRSARGKPDQSGSEYGASGSSPSSGGDIDAPGEPEYPVPDIHEPVIMVSSRGRIIKAKQTTMAEPDDEDDEELQDDDDEAPIKPVGGRRSKLRRGRSRGDDGFVAHDEDEDDEASQPDAPYGVRRSLRRSAAPIPNKTLKAPSTPRKTKPAGRQTRTSQRAREEQEAYEAPHPSGRGDDEEDDDMDEDQDEGVPTSPSPSVEAEPLERAGPRNYALRKRSKPINYAIPPPLDPADLPAGLGGRSSGFKGKGRALGGGIGGGRFPPYIPMSNKFPGAGVGLLPPLPPLNDDSDSDDPNYQARKNALAGGTLGGASSSGSGLIGAGGITAGDLAAAAGTPSNLGKISKDSALADADPLGVNTNVTFDQVGGLDEHIDSLKEMISLPLLYPEVFQQFNVTPPRGVLFHGPPGTGKTLMARALAASSRSGGKGISFFMRKGADCLSKWVGEAERQLRLLFDEARACQPSIIFFDEIDGLAPVRSSKQDQIHASIVSTLLALMDGMDGRGQVIVIGATNRPDAIDPALRRPGRFDREFYFPLPGLAARQRILTILTKDWKGWEEDKGDRMRTMLAEATKGYGGADLRALATEAALNAVQRTYPQIYKSSDRLLLNPESILVTPKDFMVSVQKLVPSSARSAASAAAVLPPQLVPLLSETFDKVKSIIGRTLPITKKRTVLEDAEFEQEGGDEDSFDREMRLQSMETLRLYRPRILIHGPPGMGQSYIGAAILHHLEGFHVQSLDLGSLLSDSTRSVEAAIVQLFVEAKRHKPSVIYIPSLIGWSASVSDAARTTMREMLDSLLPTDPILLLGIVNGHLDQVPREVRDWFGYSRETRVNLTHPTPAQRASFFKDLLLEVERPPNEFPDAYPRRKRVLEVLPIAPPLPPKQPTAAEIAAELENDVRIQVMLTHRLGPILADLKKKFKKFTRSILDLEQLEADHLELEAERAEQLAHNAEMAAAIDVVMIDGHPLPTIPEGDHEGDEHLPMINGLNGHAQLLEPMLVNTLNGNSIHPISSPIDAAPLPVAAPPPLPPLIKPRIYSIDLETMHSKLYYEGYLTPTQFLEDLNRIVHNTRLEPINEEHVYKAHQMYSAAQASLVTWEQQFNADCERMAKREKERRKAAKKEKENAESAASALRDETEGASGSKTADVDGLAAGPRRSGRNNGDQPELPVTDPVQLERRLKRQRSGSYLSSGEHGGPSNKKSRLVLSDEDAEGEEEEPFNYDGFPLSAGMANGHINGNDMMVDHASSGPVPSNQPATVIDPSLSQAGPSNFMETVLSNGHDPTASGSGSTTLTKPNLFNLLGPSDAGDVDPRDAFSPRGSVAMDDQVHAPDIIISQTREQEPAPPPRSPTPPPPLPPFELDAHELSCLRRFLEEQTASLTIEQLEQLRAMELDCVWRHRAEWNRGKMIEELIEGARDFVGEATGRYEDEE